MATRRPGWHAPTAARFFTAAAIGFAVIVAAGSALFTQAAWAARRDDFRLVYGWLADAGAAPSDRVMSIDASGTLHWTGHGGVVLVNDPLETIEEVARAYDIRWLVLDRTDTVASVGPILNGEARPVWLGAPVASRPANLPARAETASLDAVRLGLYPVCLGPDDLRCSVSAP